MSNKALRLLEKRQEATTDSEEMARATFGGEQPSAATLERLRKENENFEALRQGVKEQWLPVAEIIFDKRLQIRRDGINKLHLKKLVDVLEGGGDFADPIDVFELPDGRKVAANGFHRGEAKQVAGHETIRAILHKGTWDDALRFAATANIKNDLGLALTRDDRKSVLVTMLTLGDWLDWSDRYIAMTLGVDSPTTIANWIEELSKIGQLKIERPALRKGADGKYRDTTKIADVSRERSKKYKMFASGGVLPGRRMNGARIGERVTIYQWSRFTCEGEPELHIGYISQGDMVYTLGTVNGAEIWYPINEGSQLIQEAAKLMPAFEPVRDNTEIQVSNNPVDTTGYTLVSHEPQLETHGEVMYQVSILTTPNNLTAYLAYNANGELFLCRNLTVGDWNPIEEATKLMQGVALALQPPFAGIQSYEDYADQHEVHNPQPPAAPDEPRSDRENPAETQEESNPEQEELARMLRWAANERQALQASALAHLGTLRRYGKRWTEADARAMFVACEVMLNMLQERLLEVGAECGFSINEQE